MSFTQYVAGLEITPGRAYAAFWSAFVQVLRSTMDHEAPEGHGRSTIRVSTSVTSDRFTVMVEDDGPGTDWTAVQTACETLGGSVEIEPRPGQATRLGFTFPKDGVVYDRQLAVSRGRKQKTSAA